MKPFANLIDGAWKPVSAATSNINPSDIGDVVGEYAAGTADDVAEAVAAARAAFPQWSRTTGQARADILGRAGDELLARKDEIGELLAREEGKTRADGVGEVARSGHALKFYAGEALRLTGEKPNSLRPGVDIEITREPVGVVGIITPWNFPIAIPTWKIAPALAYGNTVVFKPADLTPACAWVLADVLNRAGLPAGVLNLVMGRGSIVGDAIVSSVDAISFTGSVPTGRRIAQQAIARMAKIQLEMGGKNPLIVLDDANLDIAVDAAVAGAFMQTGQRCTASSRLIVTEGIHDRFVDAVKGAMRKVTVGHALNADSVIGPVADKRQLETDLEYLRIGDEEGGKRFGGERLNRETEGFYLSPALFTETTNDMRINREEIFGPVASVIRVNDYEEAIVVANDTEFGLSAGICTTSLKHARHFQNQAQAGLVMVNLPTAGLEYHVPFGGRKASSYGPREQGRYAAEFFTTVKTAYVQA